MSQVEMILQGKGGVGKSLVATLLAQHCKGMGVKTLCVDTDPVSPTFSGFEAYGVKHLDLMNGDDVDPERFDELMMMLMEADGIPAVIIDNGGPSFVPLCSYLKESGAVAMLREGSHKVRFHTIVTGGGGEVNTLSDFSHLCKNFPDVPVVVWLNEFFGRIGGRAGQSFEELPVFQKHEDRVAKVITLPAVRPQTFGRDIAEMMRQRLSFDQAIAGPEFHLMSRQRMKMYWRDMEGRITAAELWKRGKSAPPVARPVVVKQ